MAWPAGGACAALERAWPCRAAVWVHTCLPPLLPLLVQSVAPSPKPVVPSPPPAPVPVPEPSPSPSPRARGGGSLWDIVGAGSGEVGLLLSQSIKLRVNFRDAVNKLGPDGVDTAALLEQLAVEDSAGAGEAAA